MDDCLRGSNTFRKHERTVPELDSPAEKKNGWKFQVKAKGPRRQASSGWYNRDGRIRGDNRQDRTEESGMNHQEY